MSTYPQDQVVGFVNGLHHPLYQRADGTYYTNDCSKLMLGTNNVPFDHKEVPKDEAIEYLKCKEPSWLNGLVP